ncbi:bcl-2-like protein 10 [Antechinus flavipes]|uniref:bcl-2-like protein 10 n=1 Tax=Antechinus flavipes TaxID=38775 RepID=UPI00223573DA|nr:bcl-2-like protein 10 [Antechinus flavipes]
MEQEDALRGETEQLVTDYLEYCCRQEGCQERPPSTPAAATMRVVAKELRRSYQDFFECAKNQLVDRPPEQVLAEVAEMMDQDGFNWGRVAVLVVFAGAMLETEEQEKKERGQLRSEMSRRLAEELCRYLVEEKGAWLRENGGWTGFHHHFTQKQPPPQSDPNSTLCCIMAAAAGFGLVGLALLLAVR